MNSRVQGWRAAREQGETVELPSGQVATLRRVHLLDLVESGRIPDELSGVVLQVIDEGVKKPTIEDLSAYIEVVNLVAIASFVDPPVAAEASEEALGVDEVPFLDRADVFRWANEGARKLRPFRKEEAGAVAPA